MVELYPRARPPVVQNYKSSLESTLRGVCHEYIAVLGQLYCWSRYLVPQLPIRKMLLQSFEEDLNKFHYWAHYYNNF